MQSNELKKQTPTLSQTGILFSIVMFLLIIVGSWAQNREIYSGLLITEYLLILLPCLLLLLIGKFDIKSTLRLYKPGILNIILIILVMAFAIPVVGVLNLLNLSLIQFIFGKTMIVQPPVAQTPMGLFVALLVIGVSPAICEETLFRGIMQKGFKRIGNTKAILFSALLFGLFHLDFQKLLGTFLLGALIGYIVHRTGSLYGGMIAHFTNNTIGVALSFFLEKINSIMNSGDLPQSQDIDFSAFLNLPKEQLIVVLFVWLIMFVFFAIAFFGLLYAFYLNTKARSIEFAETESEPEKPQYKKLFWLFPGLGLIFTFYFLQCLSLSGNTELLNTILGWLRFM